MLTKNAEKIFKLKYAINEEETWEQACLRVANHISKAEEEKDRDEYLKRFYELIYNKVFLPGGRVLANSGTPIKNLMNCFVLPLEDSRDSIYSTLRDAAEIFDQGGGVGYNFSSIREKGADLRTSGEKAAGPISFMSLFNQTGEVIQQASRRGAQLGCLDITHPDIKEFINYKAELDDTNTRLIEEYKRNLRFDGLNVGNAKYFKILKKTLQDDQLSHFNISVMVDDGFMDAVLKNKNWNLIGRMNGTNYKTKARELFNLMAQQAWESGDPGILFYDRTNEDNMVPYLGDLRSTNPCGEVPLLPYESCCLGSINLHSFYDKQSNGINYPFLEYTVRTAVRFLDNVQTISESPLPQIKEISKGLRRLGLGVMGWADLLAELNIPYDSDEAKKLGEYISWFISFFGWMESMNLASERGAFPLYEESKVNLEILNKKVNAKINQNPLDLDDIRKHGVRNVAVTSIAPTGTIALLAGVNSGIEPFFALSYKRNITKGIGNTARDYIIELNPILERVLQEEEFSDTEIKNIKKYLNEHGTLDGYSKNLNGVNRRFICSHNISPRSHVDMQASWQRSVDNSISKTINMPNNSTVKDVENILKYMWNKNLKGGTIYRDGSRTFQILEK